MSSLKNDSDNQGKQKYLQKVDDLDKLNTRQQIEKYLNGPPGRIIDQISAFISIVSCVIFVLSTYDIVKMKNIYAFQSFILSFYILEYCLRIYSAQHRFVFFLSSWSGIDLITIIPILFISDDSQYILGTQSYSIVNICIIARIIRFIRTLNKSFKVGDGGLTNVSKQLITILFTLLTLIFSFAGIIYVFEAPVRINQIQESIQNNCGYNIKKTSFFEQFYFIVVTLATVGYGDVTAESQMGRLMIILFITIAIVLIPKQTNELIRLLGLQSPYARAIYHSNSEIPFVLISGQVGVKALKNFIGELFHPDHGNLDQNAVILQPKNPDFQMQLLLKDPSCEPFITFLQVNIMNGRDLKRSEAENAQFCVIMTEKYIKDAASADHQNILTGLAIKKYVNQMTQGQKTLRLCIQLIKPESKTHYYSSLSSKTNDQLIIFEELKMNLLAKSCFCPGIINLIGMLITSSGDQNSQPNKEWQKEYIQGISHEIYRTELSIKFQGKQFSEVASIIYNEYAGIIFGIEVSFGGQTIIRLNPGTYVIPNTIDNNVHVYIICEDKKIADEVSTYDMNPEEIAIYQQKQNNSTQQKQQIHNEKRSEYQLLTEEQQTQDDDQNYEEYDMFESDFVLLDEPVSLMSISPITLFNSNLIINHIVVCGMHPSLYFFILPLRAKYLIEYQWIVILAPEKPQAIWDQINRFPKIRYIRGSPLLGEDLLRANINFADKVIILSKDQESIQSSEYNQMNELIDAESIFIQKAIKIQNKNVQIMIELIHSENIEYLSSKVEFEENKTFQFELSPQYAAGEVFISTIIDTLTCQSYYNPHIVTILQQILTGNNYYFLNYAIKMYQGGKQSNAVVRAICELADLKQSNLFQISVPENYLNKNFGELFNYLCNERNLIALGIYRLKGALDNQSPYVLTNPPNDVICTHRDKVFVLSYDMSMDLCIASNKFLVKGISESSKEQNINETDIFVQSPLKIDTFNNQSNINNKEILNIKSMDLKINNQKQNAGLDLENINIHSTTHNVLSSINAQLGELKNEIKNMKANLVNQDEIILDRVKNAIRQEIIAISQ